MANKTQFVKISALDEANRKKVKDLFTPLYGAEYAEAMVKDYSNDGEKKEVKASSKKNVK
jgi:hypothetical protein